MLYTRTINNHTYYLLGIRPPTGNLLRAVDIESDAVVNYSLMEVTEVTLTEFADACAERIGGVKDPGSQTLSENLLSCLVACVPNKINAASVLSKLIGANLAKQQQVRKYIHTIFQIEEDYKSSGYNPKVKDEKLSQVMNLLRAAKRTGVIDTGCIDRTVQSVEDIFEVDLSSLNSKSHKFVK